MSTLVAASTQKYDLGRACIFQQTVWSTATNLFPAFVHIGNTEGDMDIAINAEYSELTLPESSGPAAIKRYLSGEKPTFELGIFATEEAKLQLFSPTARGSAGQQRRRSVREHTLWIVPEQLFLKADGNGNMQEVDVTFSGGAWTKDGGALSAEDQRLRDMSLIIWRADFTRATPLYKHEDGGKGLRQVTVNVQQDFTKPDGCQLYILVGEFADFPTIDFEPV